MTVNVPDGKPDVQKQLKTVAGITLSHAASIKQIVF
jgi:hypothetical protein